MEPGVLARLAGVCDGFRPYEEARAVLVTRPADEVLRGVVGSYGQVKGAPAYAALVGRTDSPYAHERVGYTGEAVVLEATSLGLGTCWVGGFFRPEVAARLLGVAAGERVMAVIPLGYPGPRSREESIMSGFVRSHRRKPLAELVAGGAPGAAGDLARWPAWVRAALEAARLAPSAMNRQPWRFAVSAELPAARRPAGLDSPVGADRPAGAGPAGDEGPVWTITVYVTGWRDTGGISRRLDCGIAMLHLEVAALAHGVRGSWEPLPPPGVARFWPR
ncbi:MAG: nitroreductase family protein [Bacillota bacterium]|nr:nitroreductase family protein [Bacillota bacterium]MDI7249778.1 nitroreductase family protein [Bacillota bacterium]